MDEATHALLAYDLIFPELVNYRGGWFRASRFTQGNADVWFAHIGDDVQAVESMINHLDVFEDYPGRDESGGVSEASALADVLAYAWPRWARERYGIEIECRVYFSEEEGGEPEAATVTFWSVKS
jgi:hypothetical protein